MADKKDISKGYESKDFIKFLMDTAEAITAFGKQIPRRSEKIKVFSHTPGTKGESNKNLLQSKTDNMVNLFDLHVTMANKLKDAARELASGTPADKVIPDLNTYIVFFNDQLDSENKNSEYILKELQKCTTEGKKQT